jgi:hypothetical protein
MIMWPTPLALDEGYFVLRDNFTIVAMTRGTPARVRARTPGG